MAYAFLKPGDQIDVHQLAADLKFAYDTTEGCDSLPQEVADRIARRIDALDGEDGIIHVAPSDKSRYERIEEIVREEFKHPDVQRNLHRFAPGTNLAELFSLPLSLVSPVRTDPSQVLSAQEVAEKIQRGALAYGERISLDQAMEIAQAIEKIDNLPQGGTAARSYSDLIAKPAFQRFIASRFPHLNATAVGHATAVALDRQIRLEIPERFRFTPSQEVLDEIEKLGIPREQVQLATAGVGFTAQDLKELNRQLEILRSMAGPEAQGLLNQVKSSVSAIIETMNVQDSNAARQAEDRFLQSGLMDYLRSVRVALPNICSALRAGTATTGQVMQFLSNMTGKISGPATALSRPVGAAMQLGRSQLGATVLGQPQILTQAEAAAARVANAAPPGSPLQKATMVGGLIVFVGALAYFGLQALES